MGVWYSPCRAPIERGFTISPNTKVPLYRSFAWSLQSPCEAPMYSSFAWASLGRVSIHLWQQYAARGICSSLFKMATFDIYVGVVMAILTAQPSYASYLKTTNKTAFYLHVYLKVPSRALSSLPFFLSHPTSVLGYLIPNPSHPTPPHPIMYKVNLTGY